MRDDALIASRHVLPRWGGDLQLSVPDAGYVIRRISIDGGAWLDVPHSTFTMPPHAPGTVDVTALTESGKIITARALLTFDDPDAPPDPALWEPLLFPVALCGNGAFGSRWSTTNTIHYDLAYGSTWFRTRPSCNACGESIGPNSFPFVMTDGGAAGTCLDVERGGTDNLRLTSRLYESTSGLLTPLPVFRAERRPRRSLRMRYVGNDESGKPDFAVVDLTGPFIHRDGNAAPINVRVRTDEYGYGPFIYRLGAVLSMTDDDSQRVAVFASQ